MRCRALALGFVAAAALGTSYPSISSAATVPVACDPAALSAAIETVNGTAGPDTLELAPSCVYSFTTPYSSGSTNYGSWFGPSALPAIASDMTIDGNGATIRRDAAATAPFRLFFVGADPADPDTFDYATPGAGSLALREVTLLGGLAKGGNSAIGGGGAGLGGAIFSQGDVTLNQTTIADSVARGGSSGTSGLGAGGGGIGANSTGNAGGGFGGGAGFGGGSGGSGGAAGGGGGGGGFRASDDGFTATTIAGANGGGAATGLGGVGGGGHGAGGNGSGGGGSSTSTGVAGNAGGDFGGGGGGGNFPFGSAGGGGVGGGGGAPYGAGGGGGFGGGGGYGDDGGGTGGFGGGGGGGGGGDPGGSGGFGGGAGTSTADGGGGAGMGGAIFNHQGDLTVQNSTLSQNSAQGGGVWATGSAQTGSGLGGAIFNLNGELTLDSATVAFNGADTGGAIYNLGYLAADGASTYTSAATLINSILSDSAPGADLLVNRPATVSGGLLNLVPSSADASDPDVIETRAANGGASISGTPITADPGLDVLALNGGLTPSHAIGPSSSALNAGATSLNTDQRGVTRPQGIADDIGAFEYQVVVPNLTTSSSPDIALGGQVHDIATLAGGSSPTGQLIFKLYGPDDANCSGPAVFTDAKPVNGNGSYDSANFAPAQAGTYRWIASYSGDADNAAVSGACNDAGESVTVVAPPTPEPDPTPTPDPSPPPPELKITDLQRDRVKGTATLTVATNLSGALRVKETNKVKASGPVDLAEAGSAELRIVPRNRAAETLRRTGRVTVNPQVMFAPASGGETGVRHKFDLRLD